LIVVNHFLLFVFNGVPRADTVGPAMTEILRRKKKKEGDSTFLRLD
jgi:hypothetical protein